MTILSKYVLREHVGPLTFALTALTSIMMLNFISRQFGELVGKGLPWQVIGEFFLLAIPFTVALTVPMSVLVAVLYAYSRLAAENEITALKASGVSPWRLVSPALGGGIIWSLGLLIFNDQLLPRANHRLAVLQADISQAKPTFLLKEQVINTISEGKLYLKAGKIDRAKGGMTEVVIYNLADPTQRRTIYADSGTVAMTSNGKDLTLDLFHGQMQQVSTTKPGELSRLFFDHDRLRVRDVGSDTLRQTESADAPKGDREMSVCEMQTRLAVADRGFQIARADYENAKDKSLPEPTPPAGAAGPKVTLRPTRGIGWAYCTLVDKIFGVKKAHAAAAGMELHGRHSDTALSRQSAVQHDSIARKADSLIRFRIDSQKKALTHDAVRVNGPPPEAVNARILESKVRLDMAERSRNRFEIEIHKKFSLAAACLIFVILGAPIAVRFPRGGVGLVLVVSLVVFALYYVGLIGGEALANDGKIPPFWAMWGTNVIMTLVGVVMLARMGRDQNTGRGGTWGDRIDALKARFKPRRRAWPRPAGDPK